MAPVPAVGRRRAQPVSRHHRRPCQETWCAKNDGWASGTVTRILDSAVGANFRPISKPDYRYLAHITGLKTFDYAWAREFATATDAHWRTWTEDPGRWCDTGRNMTFGQMMRVAFRHELIDGEALALLPMIRERVRPGPRPLRDHRPDHRPGPPQSNPQQAFDNQVMRGGVEIDNYGAAVAYQIRKAHQGDWFAAADSVTWVRVPRETPYGRPLVVHHFVADRAGQHRGGAGIFTPVMQRLKMLIKYDNAELDAAIVNAIFAAYVESPMDPSLVKQAMGGDEGELDAIGSLGGYQDDRIAYARENGIALNGAMIPHLFPGEAIRTISATRPAGNFAAFENAMLRHVASGAGLSAQQVSNDWSDVNYSSARAALLESWKTLTRRRHDFAVGFASPIRSAWLEEAMAENDLPLPDGAPDYMEARHAYSRCRWMGPGRGWIDPVSEKQGAVLGLDAGLSTLEDEVAENSGADWEEVLHQRKHEIELMKELGIPQPEWTHTPPPGMVMHGKDGAPVGRMPASKDGKVADK